MQAEGETSGPVQYGSLDSLAQPRADTPAQDAVSPVAEEIISEFTD